MGLDMHFYVLRDNANLKVDIATMVNFLIKFFLVDIEQLKSNVFTPKEMVIILCTYKILCTKLIRNAAYIYRTDVVVLFHLIET